MAKQNKPAIRFKGFTDAWEQRKLFEMCGTFEYGLNAAAKEFDGKNKYIRITDIDDASREFLLSDLSSPDICLDGMSKYLLSSGDIVFARTGASVGKTYIYRENDGIVYFAGFLIRAKVNQDNDAEFVFQSTLSPSYEKYIRITSQRSGQPGVNAQEYGEYDLFAPSKEEQQRIGHFLRGIDSLITLHQRKYDKLQVLKKAMLEKMFPKNGSSVPEIRFKGFTDAWEQRKAKELCNIGTGKSNTQDQVEDGIYPFYIRSDIPVKSNKYLYDCEAVITIGDGNIGRVFHYVNGKFDLHQRCYKMTDFQDIWGKYFYYFFSTRFYDRAMKMTAKATVDSVRLEMISEMDIWKPTAIDEQKKIAEFFANLDHLITLHQRELEKLQNIKKSMLEKMFV